MAQFSPGTDANYAVVVAHRDHASASGYSSGLEQPSQVPPPVTLGATSPGVTGRQKELWNEAFEMYIAGATTDNTTATMATVLASAIKAADYAAQLDGNRSTIAAGAGVGTWVVGQMGK